MSGLILAFGLWYIIMGTWVVSVSRDNFLYAMQSKSVTLSVGEIITVFLCWPVLVIDKELRTEFFIHLGSK